MNEWIAQRDLLYSPKGENERKHLTVRIGKPYLLEKDMVNFQFAEGTAGCTVQFIGLEKENVFEGENVHEVYGADTLQAIQLASDIEPILKRLSKKYDIYFPCGEPYFESDDQ